MCKHQERADALELELSEVRRNYEEARKLDAERDKYLAEAMKSVRDMKYQPWIVMAAIAGSSATLVTAYKLLAG